MGIVTDGFIQPGGASDQIGCLLPVDGIGVESRRHQHPGPQFGFLTVEPVIASSAHLVVGCTLNGPQ